MKHEDRSLIIQLVALANPGRNSGNLNRRTLKLFEELGELSEAYLNATSTSSYKDKSWSDVREEAADVLIVAIDIALTVLSETDDAQNDLIYQVKRALPLDEISYDEAFLAIARAGAEFGTLYARSVQQATWKRRAMVIFAFALVEKVFRGGALEDCGGQSGTLWDGRALVVPEIERKLAKWAKNRKDKVVGTDAE